MCPFVYCSIYFEFAGIGRPERGGWAYGQTFVRNNDGKKFVSLLVCLLNLFSLYDMWSLVLVPVLDEKPCEQLL